MPQPTPMARQRWSCSTQTVLLAGAALRLALLIFGEWQDAHLELKYTDIDYAVITDAAAAVAAGGSPFERRTFRYTPMLAWAALPNVWLHHACGKVLFAAADILAGWMMDALLHREGVGTSARAAAVAAWLFNPFTVTISTRGSGEALVACQLLGLLLLQSSGQIVLAGALFGLAVHWRIYPMIYALPILLSLRPTLLPVWRQAQPGPSAAAEQHKGAGGGGGGGSSRKQAAMDGSRKQAAVSGNGDQAPSHRADPLAAAPAAGSCSGTGGGGGIPSGNGSDIPSGEGSVHTAAAGWRGSGSLVISLFSRQRLEFGVSAAAIFIGLAALFHQLYGWQFIEEAYLYHGRRRDPRHNFSPLFYPTYLALGGATSSTRVLNGVATTAQLAAVAATGWRFAPHLPTAWLLQTLAFVAFNKVVTAQYFVWYFSLAPLVVCTLQPATQRRSAAPAAAWLAAAAHWLGWAYALEFRGAPVHIGVWAAGLLFLAANVALLCQLAAACAEDRPVQLERRAAAVDAGGMDGRGSDAAIGGNGVCAAN